MRYINILCIDILRSTYQGVRTVRGSSVKAMHLTHLDNQRVALGGLPVLIRMGPTDTFPGP